MQVLLSLCCVYLENCYGTVVADVCGYYSGRCVCVCRVSGCGDSGVPCSLALWYILGTTPSRLNRKVGYGTRLPTRPLR